MQYTIRRLTMDNTFRKLLVFSCTCYICVMLLPMVISMGQHNFQTPVAKLSAYEKYKDFFRLVSSNFSSEIFKRKDPWVVLCHEGDAIPTAWKTMAASMRGVVWVGLLQRDEQITSQVFKELQEDVEEKTLPLAIIYPYGTKKTKQTHMTTANTALQTKNDVLRSIPDNFVKMTGNDLQDLLIDSFSSAPSRFPVLLITVDTGVDAVFRSLAVRFTRYFNFRKMINPSTHDLAALGMENIYLDFPAFVILTTTDPTDPSLNAIIYSRADMGELNYPNVMRFLFSINAQYRHLLPGDSMSGEQDIVEMLDVQRIEEERFDFVEGEGDKASMVINEEMFIESEEFRDEL